MFGSMDEYSYVRTHVRSGSESVYISLLNEYRLIILWADIFIGFEKNETGLCNLKGSRKMGENGRSCNVI